MAKKPSQYASIAELRSSLYPGSAGMLDLGKEEILDFPSTLAGKARKIMEAAARNAEVDDSIDQDAEEPEDDL